MNKNGMMLTGVSYLMIGLDRDSLQPIVQLLLQLWNNHPIHSPPSEQSTSMNTMSTMSMLDHGLILMKLFHYVFIARYNKGIDPDWIDVMQEEISRCFESSGDKGII